MTETYNPIPKCRICQRHHWLRDGCSGDFHTRRASVAPARPAKTNTKPKRKTKKRKAK